VGGRGFDWILFFATIPLLAAGLVTMNSFTGVGAYFGKQVVVVLLALGVCVGLSFVDFRFLRRTQVLTAIYLSIVGALCALFIVGSVVKGAQSWIHFGLFSFQPSDPAKLALILVLAKYFSRRHIEIANVRHILVSGAYAFILFSLILVQPDFGSAFIIFMIWFGMVLVSGISKKHLALVATVGIVSFALLWVFALKPYQKQRIMTFVAPQANISSTGYNAYQSTIAVGSGQVLGKGLGFGTQSRLNFLPEYQTDFIFAAFAEEWGLIGSLILFVLYLIVVWRILLNALYGASNFEILFGLEP
jgi:rod shape determining protein RodA